MIVAQGRGERRHRHYRSTVIATSGGAAVWGRHPRGGLGRRSRLPRGGPDGQSQGASPLDPKAGPLGHEMSRKFESLSPKTPAGESGSGSPACPHPSVHSIRLCPTSPISEESQATAIATRGTSGQWGRGALRRTRREQQRRRRRRRRRRWVLTAARQVTHRPGSSQGT